MIIHRILLLALFFVVGLSSPRVKADVVLLEVDGAIGPATTDFVIDSMQDAQTQGAQLIILRMDTPGGLDSSMRDIIRAILASPIPVATYVAPGGARAASAGTYILYASHIAAMAPATNLGSATPVQIGGLPLPDSNPSDPESEEKKPDENKSDQEESEPQPAADKTPELKTPMERKIVNDARAYLRALAQLRQRNVQWADEAVTQASSLSAEEALQKGVIDMVATDTSELLQKANGRVVKVASGERTLATTGAAVKIVSPDWRNRLLAVITNPQVAYILLLLGIYGLFFELSNPGALVPGVLGGISLLLALFAFQVLPINYAGLALIILGLLFMIGEAFVPSFGALGLGGIVAFVVGSLILWDETGPGYAVPLSMIVGFALASAAVLIGLSTLLVRQRHRHLVSGDAALNDASGVVLEPFVDGRGRVRVQGESWQARSKQSLQPGMRVEITGRDGLILFVQSSKETSHV
jgi:membrane-bound serine protease (ClpP class)